MKKVAGYFIEDDVEAAAFMLARFRKRQGGGMRTRTFVL